MHLMWKESMNPKTNNKLPLIYSCSGCSNIAQLANRVALELDHEGVAEMSCIAGVGGEVPLLVKKAKSGRDIIALDGCLLQCVKQCLVKQKVEPKHHMILTDYGFKKEKHIECSDDEKNEMKRIVLNKILD